jgi:hypothetical protein
MLRTLVSLSLLFAVVALLATADGQEKDKKKRTGTITGEIKTKKDTPNGKNTIIEVLAPGEEKARPYRVMYDPAIKGPIQKILAAVRAAKVGDQVRFEWIDTGEGLAITSFAVLRKTEDDKK